MGGGLSKRPPRLRRESACVAEFAGYALFEDYRQTPAELRRQVGQSVLMAIGDMMANPTLGNDRGD
jgi:hypothetical protein